MCDIQNNLTNEDSIRFWRTVDFCVLFSFSILLAIFLRISLWTGIYGADSFRQAPIYFQRIENLIKIIANNWVASIITIMSSMAMLKYKRIICYMHFKVCKVLGFVVIIGACVWLTSIYENVDENIQNHIEEIFYLGNATIMSIIKICNLSMVYFSVRFGLFTADW